MRLAISNEREGLRATGHRATRAPFVRVAAQTCASITPLSHTSSRKHSDTYYGAFITKLLQRLGGSDSEAMMRLHHSPTGSPASASTRALQRLSAERAFAGMPTTDAVTGGAADTSAVPTFATAPASTSVVSTLATTAVAEAAPPSVDVDALAAAVACALEPKVEAMLGTLLDAKLDAHWRRVQSELDRRDAVAAAAATVARGCSPRGAAAASPMAVLAPPASEASLPALLSVSQQPPRAMPRAK